MTVQDHFTKYTWLRPLKNKCGLEVAKGLMEIFGDFGAPFILQSDNGREFRNSIVTGLKTLWPGIWRMEMYKTFSEVGCVRISQSSGV